MKQTIDEQIKIIKKGADTIVNEEELRKKLERAEKNNKPLIIKT